MPILIFSHGFGSMRFQNYTLSAYLASHGYIVVSPDHTCNASLAPFPDGMIYSVWWNAPLSIFERVDDVSFLIDVFTQNPPAMFQGRLDSEHVGIFGHSFGGWTVTESIKHENRALAMVQLASFGLPPVPDTVTAPSMYFWGQQDRVMNPFESWHQGNIDNMPAPKWELEFIDTGHFAFSDLCVYNPDLPFGASGCGTEPRVVGEGMFTNPTPEEMYQMYHPYIGAFFGAVFFEYEELFDFIEVNHYPDRIVIYEEL
jgi:predicted dienelactone hydrolase